MAAKLVLVEKELAKTNKRNNKLKNTIKKINLTNEQISRDSNNMRDVAFEPNKLLADVGHVRNYSAAAIAALAVKI